MFPWKIKNNKEVFTIQEEVEKAEQAKADLLLCKVSADEEYIKAEEKLIQLKNLQEKQHKDMMMSRDTYEVRRKFTPGCEYLGSWEGGVD